MELWLFSQDLNQRAVELFCYSRLTISQVGDSKGISNVYIIRRQFSCCFQLDNRLRQVAEQEIGFAEHLVRAGVIRGDGNSLTRRSQGLFILSCTEASNRPIHQHVRRIWPGL